ncbi:MAG: translocation/assembly module TamB [Chlorobiaceae bacterium]|nr:translocation/assembly module TamB [Chlorobiaceae bacterium]
MEKAKKYTLLIMAAVSAAILALVVITAFVLNTGTFDLIARQQILALFNDEYLGRLEMREMQLRFPDKVTIVAPAIYEDGAKEPAVTAQQIRLKFNFLALLKPRITVLSFKDVEVEGFRGRVVQHDNGHLNLESIFSKRHPDRPEVLAIGKFRSRHLSVRKGSLTWVPNNAPAYELREFSLDMSKVFVAKYQFMGSIDQMQFTMPDRGFVLRKGAGSLALSSVRSELIGLDLETDKSSVKLSVSMDGLDLFSGISTESVLKNQAFVHVESVTLHTDDLNRFYPMPSFPAGVYRLKGDAKGSLSDLQILPVTFEHGDSRIAFKGEMLNVLDKKNLSFQLQFDKSKLSSGFLDRLLKDERYNKLARDAGGVEFNGKLRGRLDRWLTDMAFKTAIGEGSVEFETARRSEGRYMADGKFTVDKIEPHRLIGIEKVKSGFSGSGSFRGDFGADGVESGRIESTVKSAFWQQQQLSSGSIVLDFSGRKLDLSTDLQHTDGSGIVLAGTIDFSSEVPSYQLGGRVKRLDLSKVAASPEFKSDLNGSFEMKGQGFDPSTLNIKANMAFAPSTINEFQIRDRSPVSASIVQSPTSSSITLTSDAIDLSMQGSASLTQVMGSIRQASSCVSKEFGLSQSVAATQSELPYAFSYRVSVRDLAPLRPLLPVKELQFQGNASGKGACSGGVLSLDADIGIGWLSNGPSFSMSNAAMKGEMKCGAGGVSSASLSGSAASMSVAGKELKSLHLVSSFDKGLLTTSMDLAMPQFEQKLTAAFRALRSGQSATVTVDKLQLSSPQGIWMTAPGTTVDLAPAYSRFNRFRFSKGNQSVELDGLLSSTMPGTFRCTLSNIDLAEMRHLLLDPKLNPLSGRANGLISVSGAPGSKTSEFELKGNDVAYDEMKIGTIRMTAGHSGDRLRFDFDSYTSPAAAGGNKGPSFNTIRGSGSIPLHMNFSPFEVSIPENLPLQASFHSDDLSARFIAYVVPLFDYAEGIIPTDIRISGTMPRPDIFLTTRLNDTKLRIAPTQVAYRINGEVTGTPSRIDLGSIKVRDSLQGTGTISGLIRLEGLNPRSVNLGGTFRNLMLYNKKDLKDDTSFGTITGSTENLLFYGELTAPTAEGELTLTSADFSLYRKGSNESAKYIGVEKFIEFVPRRPVANTLVKAKAKPAGYPQFNYNLLDILQIRNLKLNCNEPLKGTMIFDRIRGERIESSINNLSLVVNKVDQRFSLYGSVDIIGGKYTFSNSSFDLDDGGRVVWNNEEIRDGRLENIYGGKQVSAYDAQTGERDKVKLLIAVSGTLDAPNVRMGYYLNDDTQPYSAMNMIGRYTSHIDPNADLNVVSMLFSRQWYLNPERQAAGGNIPVSSVGVSAGSGMLSSQLSSIVQDVAGLESFNVNLGTGTNGNLSGLELYFAMLVPGTNGKIRLIGTGSTPTSSKTNTTTNYYGSSQKIEYRVNPKVYIEAFRSYGMNNNDAAYSNLQKPTQNWGVSVSYREKFHTWSQFMDHVLMKKEKKE